MPRKRKTDTTPAPEMSAPQVEKADIPTYTILANGDVRKGLQLRQNIQLDNDIAERLNVLAQRREKTVNELANKLLRQVLKV